MSPNNWIRADQEVVYLLELVVARLYLRVVYLVLVLLELVTKGHLEEGSRPIRLVVGSLSRNAVGLRYELRRDGVEWRSVMFVGNDCDLLRLRSDVVIELPNADVADFDVADLLKSYGTATSI